jgi:hypothetical protein
MKRILDKLFNIPDHASITTASDGKAVLLPQPWNDLHFARLIEMVNWKETVILYIASLIALTVDDGGAIRWHHVAPPSPLFDIILTALRSPDWSTENRTWVPDYINHAIAGNVFILGARELLYGFLHILDAFRCSFSLSPQRGHTGPERFSDQF